MPGLTREEAASGAGVDVGYVDELSAAGVLPRRKDGYTPGDVRRIRVMESLQEAGLPLDEMVAGFQQDILTLDFVDQPEYDRMATLSNETFEQVSFRTGVPL
ncbi:MAG: hypothetical protein QOI92_1428 [Chloroflexota bacterium]|jgi:hypothetical protein|nr:hypothetical protein [Chloroflexota bacterium]